MNIRLDIASPLLIFCLSYYDVFLDVLPLKSEPYCIQRIHAIFFHYVLKIKSVKWDPLLSTLCRRRSQKLSITRWVISCGMAVISWRIASLSCSIDRGRLMYTFDLRYPQRKESHGFKSGERADKPMSPRNEIKWPGNIFLKIPIARREVWAVAPSCWNHCPYRGAYSILVWEKSPASHNIDQSS